MRKTALLLAAAIVLGWSAYADHSLVDASKLEYQIETSTSESGCAEEASYTTSVTGSTSYGATTTSTFSDAFDDYGVLYVNGTEYENNGAGALENNGRQVVTNTQKIGNLEVKRKVFVPDDDAFCRWLNIITNTATSPEEVLVHIESNMGSDSYTIVAETSSTTKSSSLTKYDTWFVTTGDFGDPRAAHVVQGPNAPVGLSHIYQWTYDYADYFDSRYEFTLQPGQTGIIMTFVSGQPFLNAAIDQAKALVALGGSALDAMTDEEMGQVLNFSIPSLTVSVRGIGTVDPAQGVHRYPYGTVVPLNATPGTGKAFLHWEGDSTEPLSSIQLTMDGDKAVTAVFVDAPELPSTSVFTLTIQAPTAGGGTTIPAPGTYNYIGGSSVELFAEAGDGYAFSKWEGDVSGTNNPKSIVITADTTVRPVFTTAGGLQCPTGTTVSGRGDATILLLAAGALMGIGMLRRLGRQGS